MMSGPRRTRTAGHHAGTERGAKRLTFDEEIGRMRIIGGQFKGRKLLAPPPAAQTRPITGSVKKSLFGMLGPRLDAATVMDLYCGTGTLGLEALSCGAQRCCFADRDRAVLARLRRNIDAVGATERCEVRSGDVERQLARWLAQLGWQVDVAFVDPPYADVRRWSWDRAAERIFAPLAEALTDEGIVVLRSGGPGDPPQRIGPLETFRLRRYGKMRLALLGLTKGGRA